MNIEILREKIWKYKEENEAKLMKEREENKRIEEEEKKFWENERKLAKKKKIIYREILLWVDEFVKTGEFKDLFSIMDEIVLFRSNWGHKRESDGGCWSDLILDKKGRLRYESGYKWMPHREKIGFNYEVFTFKYLMGLYEFIRSGRVYGEIL